ncbi:nuclear RNA export factor 1 [Thecamonas trahens ATCC 50062]|uniref:Nuclear RNA export factor 1 n=1 Tax=Thecamonas trahens ATCC 50062 TaxID=461836 RepID=A0A0L0DS48_THETB|nr:nuclear RNA export factor 1 [Thecamonas trahens ATCC 50062]KNC54273.1 nuclear RNA export factor 1 [Thecamonas trahens ATCC 50062]|eukprot:XP_013753905.1 nuclear RNA export factor 1 [Thecamonas trahens ATCC 50062]
MVVMAVVVVVVVVVVTVMVIVVAARVDQGIGKSANYARLSVYNTAGATEAELVDALTELGGGKFRLVEADVQPHRAFLVVASKADADRIIKAHEKPFRGKKLSIRIQPDPSTASTPADGAGSSGESRKSARGQPESGGKSSTRGGKKLNEDQVAALEKYIADMFNAETGMLNLNGMSDAPQLADVPVSFAAKSFTYALLQGIAKRAHGTVSLSLDSNRISWLSNLRELDQYAPALLHLSLAGNEIGSVNDLESLSKLEALEVLNLADNPVAAATASRFDYQSDVTAFFPNLKWLDNIPVEPLVTFALPPGLLDSAPVNIRTLEAQGSYADSPSTTDIVGAFIARYFECYDGDRSQLLAAYNESACMSLSVTHPDVNGRTPPGIRDYDEAARSLSETSLDVLTSRLHSTNIAIISFLRSIRATVHDPSSFIVDTAVVPVAATSEPMVTVSIHGVFREADEKQMLRGFDRTFIIAASPPGSRAAALGWPVVILNDMLHIRSTGFAY